MKSVETALGVLSLFKDADGPLGVMDVSARMGLGKGHASRILAALRSAGYLRQDPVSRKYRVDLEAFAVGERYIADNPMTRQALPVMRTCSTETGHSVYLSVRHGGRCRHILAFEGPHFQDTQWRVGIPLALHATASGKLLLAIAPDDERAALLDGADLERFTPDTITDTGALQIELDAIRARGWSSALGETVVGLAACAVPVYGDRQAVLAALGIVAPADLLPDDELRKCITILRDRATRLSFSMGAKAYPYGAC
ncbi:IclR family transcriptional regulator [Fodinicurvata sp. EGI_FJ10296]|uniref:IclR family transcriptional regulator n=1 Tax=Fodinicurvata sp. EGI_FJ10296 TaxID=3231908 RepID=UPI0034570736